MFRYFNKKLFKRYFNNFWVSKCKSNLKDLCNVFIIGNHSGGAADDWYTR